MVIGGLLHPQASPEAWRRQGFHVVVAGMDEAVVVDLLSYAISNTHIRYVSREKTPLWRVTSEVGPGYMRMLIRPDWAEDITMLRIRQKSEHIRWYRRNA